MQLTDCHEDTPGLTTQHLTARAAERHSLGLTHTQYWVAIAILLISGLALRVWDLAGADLWTDEMLTSLRATVPLPDAIDSILAPGNQLPLYYFMLRVLPNDSELLLRLPSVALGLVSVLLVITGINHLYHDRLLALGVGALLAFNPLHVLLSRTARFYTLLMVLALVNMFVFLLILRGRRGRGIWWAFGLSSLGLYLTHYTALALPAVQFLLLFSRPRQHRNILVRWTLVQGVAIIPALTWFALAVSRYQGGSGDDDLYRALTPELADIPITFLNMLMGYMGQLEWYMLPGLIAGTVGLLTGAIHLLRASRFSREHFFWLLLAVLPVVVLFVVSITLTPKYKDRYLFIAMPAAGLLFVWGWRRLSPRLMPAALVVVVMTSLVMSIDVYHSGAYQRTDWDDAADYIQQHAQPTDRLLFSNDTVFETFAHHFDGNGWLEHTRILLPDTEFVGFEPPAERVWIVYRVQFEDFHTQRWVENFQPLTPGISPLSDWLVPRKSRIESIRVFDGVIVMLVEGRLAPPDRRAGLVPLLELVNP